MPFITDDFLEKAVYPQIPQREAFIRQASFLLRENKKLLTPGHFSIYFTLPGLKQFLDTGRIYEIPEEVYRPLLPEERKALLEAMLSYCQKGIYRLLKRPLNQLTANLHLVVNHSMGYLLFRDIRGQILCLTFNEPSLINTFLDYVENLKDGHLYSGEETAQMVRKLIDTL